MKRHFGVVITLGLAAYLVLPMPGLSAPLSERIEETRSLVQNKKYKEHVLSETIAALQRQDRLAPGRHQRPPAQAEPYPGDARPEARGAARGARQARGGARAARAPAQGARRRRGRPRQPPRRALQGRRARRAHRGAPGRRLRRPARAHGVPRARLRAGPGDHRARPRPEGGGEEAGGAARRARAARRGRGQRDPRPAQRARAAKNQLLGSQAELAAVAQRPPRRPHTGARQPRRARGRPARARGRAGARHRAAPVLAGRRRRSSRAPAS